VWTVRRSAVLVTAAVLCAVTACGDVGDAVGSGSGSVNVDTAMRDGGSGGDVGGGSGGGTVGSSEDFQWPVFGPGDPPNPPGWGIYNAFAHGDCGGMAAVRDEVGGDFFTALSALCAAVVHHQDDQWTVARAAFDRDSDPSFGIACLKPILLDTLRTALAWHARHPGDQPKVGFPTVDDRTPCGLEEPGSGSTDVTTTVTTDDTGTDTPTTDPSTDEPSADPSG
jgi:hypothetical protein